MELSCIIILKSYDVMISGLKKEVTSNKQVKLLVHKAADKVTSRVGPAKRNKRYRLNRNNPY